jgi:uncharacterized protein YbjQ (UPF0145 family)
MYAVTIDHLPGFRIKMIIGEVVGIVARPKNIFTEGVKGLDGRVDRTSRSLVQSREQAITEMLHRAYRHGANAVIGMRFDHRPISDGWTEICAYGTAVFVVRDPDADVAPASNHGARPAALQAVPAADSRSGSDGRRAS